MRIHSRASACACFLVLGTAALGVEATPSAQAATTAPPAAAASGLSNDEKAAYALGFALWRNIEAFDLTPAEIAIVERAFSDAAAGKKPEVTLEEARPMLEALRKDRLTKRIAAEKEAGKAYAEKAAAEPGAAKSASGMIYRETQAGTGETPGPTDQVKVQYRGTLLDGTEFDSSFKRNQPAQFALKQVVSCWREALQKMKAGGKATIVCPSDIAYGDRGRPSIPPGATLIFEIELLEVVVNPDSSRIDPPKPEGE